MGYVIIEKAVAYLELSGEEGLSHVLLVKTYQLYGQNPQLKTEFSETILKKLHIQSVVVGKKLIGNGNFLNGDAPVSKHLKHT